MKKKNPAAGAPISIRLADDLKRDLDAAAGKLKMDTHQVMRLAMEVGLEGLLYLGKTCPRRHYTLFTHSGKKF